jgi:hypothetical protein
MSPRPVSRGSRARFSAAFLPLFAVVILAGCSSLVEGQPSPTPLDFGGITVALAEGGITISGTVSGDAGCSNPTLIATAIRFDASGLDQPAPVLLRIYIFADQAAVVRRQADVDKCIATWATDPAAIETIDAPPYVVAGQGPWGAAFKTALAAALRAAAAGTGG